jgi:hypothetical protein
MTPRSSYISIYASQIPIYHKYMADRSVLLGNTDHKQGFTHRCLPVGYSDKARMTVLIFGQKLVYQVVIDLI